MKVADPRLWLGIVSALFVVTIVLFDSERTSPGLLSPSHLALEELGGSEGCARCHGELGGSMADGCLECHADVARDLETGRALHGGLDETLARDCAACHVEHHGGEVELAGAHAFGGAGYATRERYDHRGLAFVVEGKHAAVECADCHQRADAARLERGAPRFAGLDVRCAACHDDPHVGRVGSECETCHDARHEFTQLAFFEHPARFPLGGAHAGAACIDCHVQSGELAITALATASRAPTRGCIDCHESPHSENFLTRIGARLAQAAGASCTACHAAEDESFAHESLERTRPLHAAGGFELLAPHATLACAACHTEGVLRPAPARGVDDCAACHDDPHREEFGPGASERGGCLACHRRAQFAPPLFGVAEHARCGFALQGVHARMDCAQCHSEPVEPNGTVARFLGVPRNCAACHDDPHASAFATQGCETCHASERFAALIPGAFDHARSTGFALEGAHASADCEMCHPRAEHPDVLGRRFGRVEAHFPDPRAGCAGCHGDPHAGRFAALGAADCARCHDQQSFRIDPDGGFEHARWTGFALEGVHADARCADCHLPDVASGRAFGPAVGAACVDCHTDPHAGQFVNGGRNDCARCHTSESRFDGLVFDHDRQSRFALDEIHAPLDCAACHVPWELAGGARAVRYRPIGMNCADCHGGGDR